MGAADRQPKFLELSFFLSRCKRQTILRKVCGPLFKRGPKRSSQWTTRCWSKFNRARIVDLATRQRLPVMGEFRLLTEAGALLSYSPSPAAMWWQAATYVDKILKGAKPADLPVEQPTKYELVINLKTAKALGLEVPPSLLARADEVIE